MLLSRYYVSYCMCHTSYTTCMSSSYIIYYIPDIIYYIYIDIFHIFRMCICISSWDYIAHDPNHSNYIRRCVWISDSPYASTSVKCSAPLVNQWARQHNAASWATKYRPPSYQLLEKLARCGSALGFVTVNCGNVLVSQRGPTQV